MKYDISSVTVTVLGHTFEMSFYYIISKPFLHVSVFDWVKAPSECLAIKLNLTPLLSLRVVSSIFSKGEYDLMIMYLTKDKILSLMWSTSARNGF